MRTLRFLVNGQVIAPDPTCNFKGLFPGSNDELRAEFVFSPEWNNLTKVAAFWSITGKEFTPQVLENNLCKIPKEASDRVAFKLKILGKKKFPPATLETDELTVYQEGGKQ